MIAPVSVPMPVDGNRAMFILTRSFLRAFPRQEFGEDAPVWACSIVSRSFRQTATNSGVSSISKRRGRSNGIFMSSTMVEGRPPITTTRSDRNAASRMEWVTKITVFL